jgi:hypothetical protein
MPDYYDRQGRPLGLMEWARRFGTAERIVVQDRVGPYWISTVWLGLDHAIFGGPPLIFETMIFVDGDSSVPNVEYQQRYSTEATARAGHDQAVSQAKDWQKSAVSEANECPCRDL